MRHSLRMSLFALATHAPFVCAAIIGAQGFVGGGLLLLWVLGGFGFVFLPWVCFGIAGLVA